jgi:hypothetical protein
MALTTAAQRAQSPARPTTSERPVGIYVLIGVPALLVLFLAFQLASPLLRSGIIAHTAAAVSKVSLESDPQGARVDMVLVDRVGTDTTVNADVTVKVREPDGRVWQTIRTVSNDSFSPLPEGSLLSGRTGYSVVVPAIDWARAPRRGGAATVTVTVQPTDGGDPFSTVAEDRFP